MTDDRQAIKRLIKRISNKIQDRACGHLKTTVNQIKKELIEMETEHGKNT